MLLGIRHCDIYVGWSAFWKWQTLPIKVTESFNVPCAHVLRNQCYGSMWGHASAYQAGSDSRNSVWKCVVCLAPQAVRDGHPHGGLGHYRDNYDLERLGHYVEAAVYGEYHSKARSQVVHLKIRNQSLIFSLSLRKMKATSFTDCGMWWMRYWSCGSRF